MRATLVLARGRRLLCAAPAAARRTRSSRRPGIPPPGANDFALPPAAAHPYPVILVHGTFGDMTVSWNLFAPALEAQRLLRVRARLVQPRDGADRPSADKLVAFIDEVRTKTGAAKVSLVGHSQGGMLARYVARSARASST